MTLAARGLSYTYAPGTAFSHRALENVNLEIAAGQVVLVMGGTGSGKSTLFRLLAGLLDPAEGKVELDGSPVKAGDVGMVFQLPESQLFSETVLSDVEFGPKNLGLPDDEAREAARAALRTVGLDPLTIGARSPFELSGGQARRVAIAGIIAMERPYILFDEPTAGLDGMGRDFVKHLVSDLAGRGIGVGVVSHDAEEFLEVADRAALIDAGHLVWSGSTEELVSDPANFDRAHLLPPDLLEFERQLACMPGSYSLDVDLVASWVLAGFPAGGPAGHRHDGCDHHDGREGAGEHPRGRGEGGADGV